MNARFGIELPVTLPSAEDVNAAIEGDAENPKGVGVTPQAERTDKGKKVLSDGITNTLLKAEQSKLQQQ